MQKDKKIYFASDFHLGAPNPEESLIREKKICKWLDEVKLDAEEIFLMGDIFDFWFEYKHAVPRGFTRLMGKIAEITDSGIPVHVFKGNHDMWIFDYLPAETGVTMHKDTQIREFNGVKFFLGHGDGLGPGDRGYKVLKKIFNNRICQWMFARLHPNFGIGIANFWSRKSRSHTKKKDEFHGNDKEWLVIYAKEQLEKQHFDYFIFGHRHLPLEIELNNKSKYINLGDWIHYYTYGVFDGEKMELKEY